MLRNEIERVLNANSAENKSDTPDFILASYLLCCLEAFDNAVVRRDDWYGRRPGARSGPCALKQTEAIEMAEAVLRKTLEGGIDAGT